MVNTDEKVPLEIKNFDNKGRLLESKTFYDGRLNTNERTTYQGKIITTELCDYCSDLDKAFADFSIKENQKNPYAAYATDNPRRTIKTIKTTDKDGNIIVSKSYNSQGYLNSVTKAIFDKKSNLLLKENFEDEGKKTPYFKKNTFNSNGLLEQKITFANRYESKSTYSYDKLDRKIIEKQIQVDRTTEYHFEYGTKKDTTLVLTYYKSGNESKLALKKRELSYLEKDIKITKEINLNHVKILSIDISHFDKKNNLILKKNFNDKNELRSEIKLIYDKKANWIEMEYCYLVNASYNGNEPKPEWRTTTYIRTIVYY